MNSPEPDLSFTNLKMMSESSKRHSKLLSLIFILKLLKLKEFVDLLEFLQFTALIQYRNNKHVVEKIVSASNQCFAKV